MLKHPLSSRDLVSIPLYIAPRPTSTMHNTSVTSSQGRKASPETAYGLSDSYLDLAHSASVKMESQDYSPPTTIGLGIYQNAPSSLPVTQSLPIQDWSNQPVVGSSACFHSAVGAPDYNTFPYFQQQFPSGPVMMRISGLVPHNQSTPVYYSSDISARSCDSPIYGEASSWSITPQSQMETPLRYPKQEPHVNSPMWEASLSPTRTNLPNPSIVAGRRLVDSTASGVETKSLDQSPSLDGTESVAESDACRHLSVEGSASPDSVISTAKFVGNVSHGRQTAETTPSDMTQNRGVRLLVMNVAGLLEERQI
ncbi:hypothetical protein PISL3812_03610 [Talaromyces islandicus]|uniref:Uncharacterized protein n=1 Tax=Talaromyces islandicus TaxID=28573 RepID=A0A0U1LVJ5_TALIS|nr:hypothetical protein PISL3812_03610 [Talaromyces islandicus]